MNRNIITILLLVCSLLLLFGGGVLHASADFDAPLRMPFAGWFVPAARRDENGVPRIRLERSAPAGEHATLYLE